MLSTVLIVDDVAANRLLLRRIIESCGHAVLEAESGEACLALCETQLPNLILLDVQMPGISGYDVCERLRRYYSNHQLPIIMVTDTHDPEEIAKAFEVGVNDHVSKPVHRAVLLARMSNQFAMSQAQRELELQRQKILRALEVQRAMGDQLPEAIAIEDEKGEIIYSNKQFSIFCGNTTPRQLTIAFEYFLGGVFREELLAEWNLIHENHNKHIEREISVHDQTRHVIHLISHHIETADKIKLRLWVLRDLTKTRDLEDAASHRVKFDTLGTFSAGVAHNFNNILSGILGASELLKRLTNENPRSEKYIKVIQQSVEGGKELTRRLASMVRKNISADGEQCVDIVPCVETIVECYREATGTRVVYSIDIATDLPTVNLTERNFIDLVANLLSNAADSIKDQGEIWITARRDSTKRFVELEVRDSGNGMKPDVMNRIFEPFYSTKNLDTHNGVSCQGNGLGLWAVYNLVKGAQGDIQIESYEGVGTSVRVLLPVVTTQTGEFKATQLTH